MGYGLDVEDAVFDSGTLFHLCTYPVIHATGQPHHQQYTEFKGLDARGTAVRFLAGKRHNPLQSIQMDSGAQQTATYSMGA